jgi:branched-chain amino acid transport system substrate-binding protein
MYAIIMTGYDSVAAMMRYFRGRGWHRVALITTTDASGQASEQDFQEVLHSSEFSDLTLVANEHLAPTDISATAQISRISAASPDAVAIWTPGTPFATVLRAMKDAGMDLPTASTQANMSKAQMLQYDAILPTMLYFQTEPFMGHVAATPQAQKAQKVFFDAVKRSNLVPDALMSGSWDPAMIVVDALRHLGTNASASQLRDYIDNLHDYGGICGVYDFRGSNHRGLTQKDAIVMRWERTKLDWTVASGLGGSIPRGK